MANKKRSLKRSKRKFSKKVNKRSRKFSKKKRRSSKRKKRSKKHRKFGSSNRRLRSSNRRLRSSNRRLRFGSRRDEIKREMERLRRRYDRVLYPVMRGVPTRSESKKAEARAIKREIVALEDELNRIDMDLSFPGPIPLVRSPTPQRRTNETPTQYAMRMALRRNRFGNDRKKEIIKDSMRKLRQRYDTELYINRNKPLARKIKRIIAMLEDLYYTPSSLPPYLEFQLNDIIAGRY